LIVRIILISICIVSSCSIAFHICNQWWSALIGILAGLFIAFFVIHVEQSIRKVSPRVILGGALGVLISLLIAFLFAYGLSFVSDIMEKRQVVPWIYALLTGTMGYLGLVLGSKKVEEVSIFDRSGASETKEDRVLDTSVIIDGRIADVCDTGFLDGELVVPHFVLDELQYIADSPDAMKRARGRRGLDILNRMQRMSGITIKVVDHDFPKVKGVDAKLVALAKKTIARIITNDFNLKKVGELQGIKVLNVNELANALKPVVLPGEMMTVKIVKEGKELGQGVAYLDDGTMIVVDNAQKYQGMQVEVQVTSVLQTTAGRMIFAELKAMIADKRALYEDNSQ